MFLANSQKPSRTASSHSEDLEEASANNHLESHFMSAPTASYPNLPKATHIKKSQLFK